MKNRTKFCKAVVGGFKVAIALKVAGLGLSIEAQELLPRDQGYMTYHAAPEYRISEEHPLRIAAYIVHPVGWLLREGVTRPLSYFAASTETRRDVMGYRYPHDYRTPDCFSASDTIPDCRSLSPFNYAGEATPAEAASVYFPNVNFDFNKRTLNEQGKAVTETIAKMLASEPTLKVVLQGHADYIGSDSYNDALGMDRARSVLAELVRLGVSDDRLSAVSFGETVPLIDEKTDAARAANRRVEVH
jgi:outer membrane protein OmpA-like peptidoglycan-associated protein